MKRAFPRHDAALLALPQLADLPRRSFWRRRAVSWQTCRALAIATSTKPSRVHYSQRSARLTRVRAALHPTGAY